MKLEIVGWVRNQLENRSVSSRSLVRGRRAVWLLSGIWFQTVGLTFFPFPFGSPRFPLSFVFQQRFPFLLCGPKWNRSGTDVNSGTEFESKWNRREIEMKSMWTRSKSEVTSKWNRSYFSVKPKWYRSDIEVTSQWYRSLSWVQPKWYR